MTAYLVPSTPAVDQATAGIQAEADHVWVAPGGQMYLVKGLVDVPRRTVLAVEEAHRLALPSGDEHRPELPVDRLVAGR